MRIYILRGSNILNIQLPLVSSLRRPVKSIVRRIKGSRISSYAYGILSLIAKL